MALSRKPAKPDVLLVLIPRKGKFSFLAVFGSNVFRILCVIVTEEVNKFPTIRL